MRSRRNDKSIIEIIVVRSRFVRRVKGEGRRSGAVHVNMFSYIHYIHKSYVYFEKICWFKNSNTERIRVASEEYYVFNGNYICMNVNAFTILLLLLFNPSIQRDVCINNFCFSRVERAKCLFTLYLSIYIQDGIGQQTHSIYI